MPVLLTRRGVQGCGAGPGCEPVAVGEPGHVTDIGQDPGRHHRPDTAKILNREPRANTITLSSAVAFLILASTATSSASSSAAMLRPVLPAMSRGRTRPRLRPPQVVTKRPCEQGLFFASYRRECVEVVID